LNPANLAALRAWITDAGLAGKSETAILDAFCQRAVAGGLPLARGTLLIDTLHPVHEGRAFRWRREADATPAAGRIELIEYGPTSEGQPAENWRRSAFFHMLETGASVLRRRLCAGDPADFSTIADMQSEGMTDVVVLITRFAAHGTIGEMDCVYSVWATDARGGFDDGQAEALIGLMPLLSLAVKCVSLTRIAGTLVETYLGRDPGRRVLGGLIRRGIAETISAVLWYSDLRQFTRITDTAPPAQIIPLLNDYAEAVISAVHDHGGDVLKLIGDGTLAIFTSDRAKEACAHAIASCNTLRGRLAKLNAHRASKNLPTTEVYLGLHVGDVFYGNIGSRDRLDFTVVGPAVNEVARIAAMCRSAERSVLVSTAFAAATAPSERSCLVSVGRYALRGIEQPQELFTVDPAVFV
jgi:adenylate cyclase